MSELLATWYTMASTVALWCFALGMLAIGAIVGDAIGRFLVHTGHRAIRNAAIRRYRRTAR